MAVFGSTIRYYDPFLLYLLLLVLFLPNFHQTDAQIGVCNGRLGSNLPSSQDVVQLYKSNSDETARLAPFVLPAMAKIYDAIASAGLKDQIKVSTVTYSALVSNSFPPSQGSFDGASASFMGPIINFLKNTNNPLLFNIYPYFRRIGDPQNVPLSFALFTATGGFAQDGQFQYRNLFDAMLDAAYSAVEKVGGPNVEIIVSESGWPSAGGPYASVENAGAYYRNLINHVQGGSGSPKRPGRAIETYLFAMFDENQKSGAESEKHFGLFSANKQPKYQIPQILNSPTIALVESLVLYCTI